MIGASGEEFRRIMGDPVAGISLPDPPHAIINLKGAASSLSMKVDQLIVDIAAQSEKIDSIQRQISFITAVLWALGALFALPIAAAGLYAKLH